MLLVTKPLTNFDHVSVNVTGNNFMEDLVGDGGYSVQNFTIWTPG